MVQIRISWSQILSRQQNTREIEFSTSLQVNFIFSSICLDRNLQVQSDKIFNYTDSFGLEAKKKIYFILWQQESASFCDNTSHHIFGVANNKTLSYFWRWRSEGRGFSKNPKRERNIEKNTSSKKSTLFDLGGIKYEYLSS